MHTVVRTAVSAVVLGFMAFPSVGRAQEQRLAFDVISVKTAAPDARATTIRFLPSGRFIATNISLRELIAAAYGTPQPFAVSRIKGGPEWTSSVVSWSATSTDPS
jgi:hypothetical protein